MRAPVRAKCPKPQIAESTRVYFVLDGHVVRATRRLDRCYLPLDGLSAGRHRLEVVAFDDQDRKVAARTVSFVR